MLKKVCFTVAFVIALGACSHVDEYERHVSDWEPVYCYKSLAAIQCHREPKHADNLRLVNYYGPHPSRYDAPEPRPAPNFSAPEMINYWVKDAEPIPRAMPHGDLTDRPWLTAEGKAEQQSLEEMTSLQTLDVGTNALLRRISTAEPASASAPVKIALPAPDVEVK